MKYQHCILLPFALALLIVGLVTLLLWGVGNLEPYNHTKEFTAASCTVVSSNFTGWALCNSPGKGGSDSRENASLSSEGPSNTYSYPCLVIAVNYTEQPPYVYPGAVSKDPDHRNHLTNSSGNDHVTAVTKETDLTSSSEVILYDTYESWAAQRSGGTNRTCSMHLCNSDNKASTDSVNDFSKQYGEVGETFQCFYNPRNHVEVYAYVVTGNNILHALVWPALAMGFGFFLLIVFIFQSCEVWVCRNPKLQERRNQGQMYNHLAVSYYRNPNQLDIRSSYRDGRMAAGPSRPGSAASSVNRSKPTSRLPKLSAAADIVRKLSLRGRSSSNIEENLDRTVDSTKTYAGVPNHNWSLTNGRHFSTT